MAWWSVEDIQALKRNLSHKFDMKDMEGPKHILDMWITPDRKNRQIHLRLNTSRMPLRTPNWTEVTNRFNCGFHTMYHYRGFLNMGVIHWRSTLHSGGRPSHSYAYRSASSLYLGSYWNELDHSTERTHWAALQKHLQRPFLPHVSITIVGWCKLRMLTYFGSDVCEHT